METKTMYYTRWKLINMFREFWCNYLTIENYAEAHGTSKEFMHRAINIGRKVHNKEAEKIQSLAK